MSRTLLFAMSLLLLGSPFQQAGRTEEQKAKTEEDRATMEAERDRLWKQARQSHSAVLFGGPKTAAKIARRLLALEIKLFGSDSPELVRTHEFIAKCADDEGDLDKCLVARREIVRLKSIQYGPDDWRVTDARLIEDIVTRLKNQTKAQKDDMIKAAQADADFYRFAKSGEYESAKIAANRAIDIRKRVLGPDHHEIALALSTMAVLHSKEGDFKQAEKIFREALKIFEVSLGKNHPHTGRCLRHIAGACRSQGNFHEALELFQKSLAVMEASMGPDDEETAMSLSYLGSTYLEMSNYKEGEAHCRRAIAIAEKTLGPDDPLTAILVGNLGLLLYNQGNYAKAEPLYERSLKIAESTYGKAHPRTTGVLSNLAVLHQAQGKFAAAEADLKRVLAINERTFRTDPLDLASALIKLADYHRSVMDYAAAEPLFKRALAIYEDRHLSGDVSAIPLRNNLAAMYADMGDYASAEPLLQQTIETIENRFGRGHAGYAATANNLAMVYQMQGNYSKAFDLFQKALKAQEDVHGPDHLIAVSILNNIAALHLDLGDFPLAETQLKRVHGVREKILGASHMETGKTLAALGMAYEGLRRYPEAENTIKRSAEIFKSHFGEDHPTTAKQLSSLAGLYLRANQNSDSVEDLLSRSLKTHVKFLGPDHPDTIACESNIAIAQWLNKDDASARKSITEAITGQLKLLELTATIQSEEQQFLMAREADTTKSGYLTLQTSDSKSAESTWGLLLRWKGQITSRQTYLRKSVHDDPLFMEFMTVTQQLSGHLLSPPTPPDDSTKLAAWKQQGEQLSKTWQLRADSLKVKHEQIEKELAKKSAKFRAVIERREVTPASIKRLLAAQSRKTALVDIVEYLHWGRTFDSSEQRLSAFIVRGDASVVRVDLGSSQPIREMIRQWRDTFGDGEDGHAVGQRLREKLWQPIAKYLEGVEVVAVSPDGTLAEFPWGAIPGGRAGTYLVEEIGFAVVPVPQMLHAQLEESKQVNASPALLLVGDIDYDADPGKPTDLSIGRKLPVPKRGVESRSFSRLADASSELASIESSYRETHQSGSVLTLKANAATEAAFRTKAAEHSWIHVVSHGFFAPAAFKVGDASRDIRPSRRGEAKGQLRTIQGMLSSGIAFAGANRASSPAVDDGILTALEVSALDLDGVDCVVLSACESALGQHSTGEGLLGLQRAFQISGTRTTVASLWKVDDKATNTLMQTFYHNLWKRKLSRLEALRQAQISCFRSRSQPNEVLPPYFWAGFVIAGDWR